MMGTDMIVIYDTNEKIDSKTTSDCLCELVDHLPKFQEWVSCPDDDEELSGKWEPEWINISDAISEIDRVLKSDEITQIYVRGYTMDELADELRLFREELQEASAHTSKFCITLC